MMPERLPTGHVYPYPHMRIFAFVFRLLSKTAEDGKSLERPDELE